LRTFVVKEGTTLCQSSTDLRTVTGDGWALFVEGAARADEIARALGGTASAACT
jgi:hypothetical protein